MQKISIQQLDEIAFSSMEKAWSELLLSSDQNKLFMSWVWMNTWWEVFSIPSRHQLLLLAAYADNKLIGLAPLYKSKEKSRLGGVQRIQFIGNSWRVAGNIRSEYIDFICLRGYESILVNLFLQELKTKHKWDEFIFNNRELDSLTTRAVLKIAGEQKYYCRAVEKGMTHYIDVSGKFSEYLKNLSSKTRLKLYNQRKKLEEHGTVKFHDIEKDNVDVYFQLMNKFHLQRWEKDLFSGKRLEFHLRIARALSDRGMLKMSALTVNDKPVSILYDFLVGDTIYGFQLAFDGCFDNKISISKLHFGYAIEYAFNDAEIMVYDFLRGHGKSGDSYKGSMTVPYKETANVQLVRNKIHNLVYKAAKIIIRPAN